MTHPHFGHTKHGLPVHLHVMDYHKAETAYEKFTRRLAQFITRHVGTMNCFFLFNILALLSAPATLKLAGIHVNWLYTTIPAFFLTFGWIYLITWICQNYIQLVLLPALMVGQNLQNEASDARSAKQFEDTESIKEYSLGIADALNLETEGGLTMIEAHLKAQDAVLARLCENQDRPAG